MLHPQFSNIFLQYLKQIIEKSGLIGRFDRRWNRRVIENRCNDISFSFDIHHLPNRPR